MNKPMNIKEMERHLDTMDGRAQGDSTLYRHFMSKDEESGQVDGKSYQLGSGYKGIIHSLDPSQHQYVTLALFNSPKTRTKSTVRATSGLYVDLDDSLFNGDDRIALDLITKTLTKARIPEPTMVIHTGGGWHLYWLFNELYYINGDEDITRYESVITSIINSLSIIGADPKSKDVTRLLRLAGSYNPKSEYRAWTAVTIVESYDLHYDIGDFEGLRVVKTLPKSYQQSGKKEQSKAKKPILTAKDEPKASKESQVNKPLTRPEEAFPLHLVGDIIADAQEELEKRTPQARYMMEVNREVIVDLLLNFVGLPRNSYTFEDGTAGQYIQVGHRNHFLWLLSRRGVTYEHLTIINKTLVLPSLSHSEFQNALRVGRTLGIPKITAMISDLGITLAEQSVMGALRVDYEAVLDKHEKVVSTRVNQLITESNHQIILASKGKKASILAEELGISVRRVNQLKKQKGVKQVMSKEERIQEVRDMYKDVEKTGRIAIAELYEDYTLASEVLDRIIRNQSLIHSLKVQLSQQQREDIKLMADSIIAKVEFITSQLEAYEEFIVDDSEMFKSGKIKKSVLLAKVKKLKDSMQLVTATGAI